MKALSIVTALTILFAIGNSAKAQAGPNDFFGSAIGGSPELTQGASAAANGAAGFAAAQTAPGNGPGAGSAAQPGQQPSGSSIVGTGANIAPAPSGPPAGDYTLDEKRVQKKYKSNLRRAQALAARGAEMMKSHDEKVAKKGKVLKEIGEKAVADLKAANPFPEMAAKPAKAN
jgi:hypothetical protein